MKKPFYRIIYFLFWNKKMLEDQKKNLYELIKEYSSIWKENIFTNRNNLLILVWGLIAFIGIIHDKLDIKSEISLKITIVSFLLTIFWAVIAAIISPVIDTQIIKYKIDVLSKHHKNIWEVINKVKNVSFGKDDDKNYVESNKKYLDEIKTPLKYRILSWIMWFFTIVYIIWLIVWMSSMVYYYLHLIF